MIGAELAEVVVDVSAGVDVDIVVIVVEEAEVVSPGKKNFRKQKIFRNLTKLENVLISYFFKLNSSLSSSTTEFCPVVFDSNLSIHCTPLSCIKSLLSLFLMPHFEALVSIILKC